MAQVLIIDDDAMICETLLSIFNGMGHVISCQQTLKEGVAQIDSFPMDVVFLDVGLPDGNGLDAIEIIKHHYDPPEIIIFTGEENVDRAEVAMRSGVWNYISKKESYVKFKFALNRALTYREKKRAHSPAIKMNRGTIVGESPLIKRCLDDVARASNHDFPVLITGETGTGKRVVRPDHS
ncbi:response regulator [Desulfocicer niacini]